MEKYPEMSPYLYCKNNPELFIDHHGDSIIVNNIGVIEKRLGSDFGVYLSTDGVNNYLGDLNGTIDINDIFETLLLENAKKAKFMSPIAFRNHVKNKGDWDLKNNREMIYGIANNTNTKFLFKGKLMSSQDLGNYHYGVVAKSNIYFTEEFALRQAGQAQIKAGTSRAEWIIRSAPPFLIHSSTGSFYVIPKLIPPYGDDPIDQLSIQQGFRHFDFND